MRRKLQRGTGYAVLLLGCLGALLYLARDPGRDSLGHLAAAWVSHTLQGTLTVGAVRGSLWSALILRDVHLRDTHGTTMAHIAEVRLRYDLLALLSKRLHVRELTLVRPYVRLVQTPDGAWNVATLVSTTSAEPVPAEQSWSLALDIPQLRIHDGSLTLSTPTFPGVQQIDGLDALMRARIDAQGAQLQVEHLTAQAHPAEVILHTLQGSLSRSADGTLSLAALHLQTAQSLITGSGVFPGGTQAASLAVDFQPVETAEIGRLLQQHDLRGPLTLALTAQGAPEALELRAQLQAAPGQIAVEASLNTQTAPWQYRGQMTVRHADLRALLQRAELQSDVNFQMRIEGAGLSLPTFQGHLQFAAEPSHLGDLTLSPSRVSLVAASGRFQVQQCDILTSAAHLTATGSLDLTGHSDLQYDLTAQLAGLRQLLGSPTLDGTLHLHGTLHGAGAALRTQGMAALQRLRYQESLLTALQLTYEGTQLGTQPRISAHLTARQGHTTGLSFESLTLQSVYDHSAQQLQVTAEVRQSARVAAHVQGTWHWSEAKPHLLLQDMALHLAERAWRLEAPAHLLYDAPGLRLAGLALRHAEERLTLSGTFAGPEAQDIHLQLSQLDLTFLQRLFSLPAFVQGRASLQAHLAGTGEAPRLQAEVIVHPAAPRRAPFEQLRLLLDYTQPHLHGDLRLRQANREVLLLTTRLPVDLSLRPLPLAQRLIQTPVALTLQVQQPELHRLSHWHPAWTELSGALEAEFKVQGTYTALEVETALRLQQFGWRGLLQQLNTSVHLQATLGPPGRRTGSPAATGTVRELLQVRKAVLRLPTLRAQIVGQSQTTQDLQIQNCMALASGAWTAAGLEGTLQTLQAHVRLAALPPAAIALAGRLNPQHLELTHVQVRLPVSEIRGTGQLHWAQQQLAFRLDIPRLRLDELGVALPSPLPSLLQGVMEIRGSLTAPQVETHLHYAGGQLSATLTAHLRDTPLRYSAALQFDDLDVAALLPGAQGTLRLALHAQGAGVTEAQRRVELDLQLDTHNLSLAPGLTARLKGRLSGSTVRLEDFHLRSAPAVVVASGTFSTSPGDKTDLTYEVTLKDLSPLQPYLGTPLQAQGSFNGTLQGTWPALQVRSRLRLREWTYATLHGQRVQAELRLSRFPRAPQATLKAQLSDLRGPGWPASALEVQSTYTAPQGTVHLQVSAGPYQQTALEGRFSLAPEQRFSVSRLHLRHNGDTWDNVTPLVVMRSPDGRLEVPHILIRSGRQELSAQGILTSEGAITAQVQLRQVQLWPQVRRLAPHLGPVEGQLALSLGLSGSLAQPQIEGTLALTALRWQQHEIGTVSGQFSTVAQALQLEVQWQAASRQFLQVSGTLGLAAPHALALSIRAAEVDAGLAQALSTAVTQSSGRLDLEVQVTGTLQQPALNGSVALRDGTLQLAATGTRYTSLQARIVLTDRRVDLTQLHARSGNGVLDITGWASRTGLRFTHVEGTLQAQDFAVMHTPELEATLSAAVAVHGSLDALNATGTITLPRVRAQLGGTLMGAPEVVQPEQLSVNSVYGAGPPPVPAQESAAASHQGTALRFLRADLRLVLPQNVWVRGPGTAIELRGTLTLTKELARPFLLGGSVETVRGFASFYSGKFSIERGRVDFTHSPEINPVLDIVATREVSGYVVAVNVAGRAKTPQLRLSSTPELQQADIVTLLVVGKTMDRLTASERRAFSSQAQQIVGNVAAGELEQLLAKPLGFDAVDIQTGDNLGQSKVSVGRYMTQDIFLSYEQQLGEESGNKVGVEYSVNRHLKLKGSSTNKGAAALDLLWRIDY